MKDNMRNCYYGVEDIKAAVIEMFKSDTIAGAGFYSDEDWRKAYAHLQRMVGYKGDTTVFVNGDNFDKLGVS